MAGAQRMDQAVAEAIRGLDEQLTRLQMEVEDLLWRETALAVVGKRGADAAQREADALVTAYRERFTQRTPERESGIRMKTVGDAQ